MPTKTIVKFVCAFLLTASLRVAFAQNDKSITIHQEIDVNTTSQKVYEALLDSKQFTQFSGRTAEINREVGGAFSYERYPVRLSRTPATVQSRAPVLAEHNQYVFGELLQMSAAEINSLRERGVI